MKRLLFLLVLIAAFSCGLIQGVASAANSPVGPFGVSVWHRLSADRRNPAPEHERFSCLHGSLVWGCGYDKVPEPALNFQWNSTAGYFIGRDITVGWSCPAWFPSTVCANVTRVVGGTVRYVPAAGQPVNVLTDLVLTGTGTGQMLQLYWINQFVCPWFQTFDAAIAAKPFPLPFNGVDWPAQDCIVAP